MMRAVMTYMSAENPRLMQPWAAMSGTESWMEPVTVRVIQSVSREIRMKNRKLTNPLYRLPLSKAALMTSAR